MQLAERSFAAEKYTPDIGTTTTAAPRQRGRSLGEATYLFNMILDLRLFIV